MTTSSGSSWDRAVRSLVHLDAGGSTARTLNLVSVWRRHAEDAAYKAQPFFKNPVLNRSIIVKHRLRENERDMLDGDRTQATKLILPINIVDLRSGARSLFIGERGYMDMWQALAGANNTGDAYDQSLLQLLDSLPSLDPFLMRERLRKAGFNPARCYFDLTEADSARMFMFARQEVAPLIGISFKEGGAALHDKTATLAAKILGDAGSEDLDPLRRSMSMTRPDFEEGVFCWKGFIYYKWTLADLLPKVLPVSREIAAVTPSGPTENEDKVYILATRDRLATAIRRACETVRTTLRVYDRAYDDLARNGQPKAFREFLLQAPQMFYELGERLGAVQHVISFWRFRFPEGQRVRLSAEDLLDLLGDFETSMGVNGED